MLDQNTDRMWYVIGAVIIGAAIILILNSTFPQLFASVGNTFSEKVNDVGKVVEDLEMTDGIDPKKRTDGVNLLKYGDQVMEGGQGIYPDGSIYAYTYQSSRFEFLRHQDLAPIFEKNGLDQTYTLIFDVKSKDTSKVNSVLVYMQSGSGSKYDFIWKSVTVTEEFQTYTFTGLQASINETNLTATPYYSTAHLAFWGQYETGNVPVVRNVRLEREVD